MAHGGVFAWPDGRENPDTFQALLEYPKGFLVSYSTSFGNDCDSFSRIMGKGATMINTGGEGSPRWSVVEEKGESRRRSVYPAAVALGDYARQRQARSHVYGRRGSLSHDQLAGMSAQPQSAKCYRLQWLFALCRRNHGGAVL